jgi:hypothetical protein
MRICNNACMARRGIPKGPVNWYLPEWMAACGLEGRGAQTKMRELTGWSKATMHQLFHGEQDYSPAVVNAAAFALKAEPYELLMPPDKAFMIRRALASIKEIKTLDDESGIAPVEPPIRKIRT